MPFLQFLLCAICGKVRARIVSRSDLAQRGDLAVVMAPIVFVTPNVRAKLAPTLGRAGAIGENVQRTADQARVARRWGTA